MSTLIMPSTSSFSWALPGVRVGTTTPGSDYMDGSTDYYFGGGALAAVSVAAMVFNSLTRESMDF